jgi:hypothetical protein
MLRFLLLTAFAIASAVGAHAETTIVVNPKDRPVMPMIPGAEQVRVSVGINMFIPLTDGADQSAKAQEDARRTVYDLAGHECAVLRETVASGLSYRIDQRQRAAQSDFRTAKRRLEC